MQSKSNETKSKTTKSSDVLTERKNRFAKTSSSTLSSETIEKPYFRLTSAADPSTLRPLNILEQAFHYVMNKYRTTHDWNYLSSQLKSIRQDLMVQSIRNDFTLMIYEENARQALQMNDREQFVQCQTQIEMLYDEGRNRDNYEEFLLYRYLYSLLIQDNQKSTRTLIDLNELKTSKSIEKIRKFSSAFRRKDFFLFFTLYQTLPYLCQSVVNIFLDSVRKQVVRTFLWSFLPTVPLDFLTKILSFPSDELCREYLKTLNIVFIDEMTMIDCKKSRIEKK